MAEARRAVAMSRPGEIEIGVSNILCSMRQSPTVNLNARLVEDLGLDSLEVLLLLEHLEEAFDLEIPDADVESGRMVTGVGIIAYLHDRLARRDGG